jgi:polar amino acid transport system substrate-binding protein
MTPLTLDAPAQPSGRKASTVQPEAPLGIAVGQGVRFMKSFRLAAVIVPLAAISLLVGACSSDSGDDQSTAAGDLTTVSPGKLTVCTDAPYEPFEFEDADGNWTGFDMDLLREIAGGIGDGLELAVTVQPFDGIWLAPAAGTCDIVASAMTITPERSAQALFSDPYYDSAQSLMVLTSRAGELTSLDTLTNARIGVQTGTTGATYAEENKPAGATVVEFDEPAAMFLALDSGGVDALLQDLPVNVDRANQRPGDYELVSSFSTGESYGFAVAKNNTVLIEAVNGQLAELRSSGGYQTIYDRYFATEE